RQPQYRLCTGWQRGLCANRHPLAPPTRGDTIVYAVCPAQFVKIAKAVVDTMGHYARPDLFTLGFHADAHQGTMPTAALGQRRLETLAPGELTRIADRHEVAPA